MAKDPATLFYWNDWHTGTMTMSRHHKGCYMDLLAAQFNSGHLSIEEIKTVLGNDFAAWQGALSKKFVQDSGGFFFNEKLDAEINKRREFSQKQRERVKKRWGNTEHDTEDIPKNENENENENKNKNENKNENKGGVGGGVKLPNPNQAQCEMFFQQCGKTLEEGENFFHHYEKKNWVDGSGQKITNWTSLAQQWILKPKKFDNGKINRKATDGNRLLTAEYLTDLHQRIGGK